MDMRAIRFGIEIETIRRTREQAAAAIHSVVGGTIRHVGYPASYDPWEVEDLRGRKWKVVADASLSSVPFVSISALMPRALTVFSMSRICG